MNRFLAGFSPIVIALACLAGASFQSIPDQQESTTGQPQAQSADVQETTPEQSYIGTGKCITCHRKQGDSWSETNHAKAFEHLPAKYREDTSCLKCHVTGLGEPGGYVAGMTSEEAEPLLNVGCESCHGPGAAHEAAVQRWTLADPADEEKLLAKIKATIVKTLPDSQCGVCHQNQSHQAHPKYDGQPLRSSSFHDSSIATTSAGVSPSPSPNSYSVKTCGSCHYMQYKTWLIDKHTGLSAGLPAKYENDESCLKCHRKSGKPSDWFTAETDPQADAIPLGVGCESCHGSAKKHVLFNKQFIGSTQLTPELREATRELMRNENSASACLQCHVRDGHKEHPEYEKPDDAKSK